MTSDQAQQDLAYIRGVMSQTQRFTQMSGSHMILWGVLVSIGILATWFLGNTPRAWLLGIIWGVIGLGGSIFSAWLGYREQQRTSVARWAGKLIGNVWLACGMGYIALLFVGMVAGNLPYSAAPGMSAVITGIGIYLSGVLAGMGWLRNTAWLWWIAAVVMLIMPGRYTLLLFVGLLLILYIVPGFILRQRYAQELHDNNNNSAA